VTRRRSARPAAFWLIGAAAIGFLAGAIVTPGPARPLPPDLPIAVPSPLGSSRATKTIRPDGPAHEPVAPSPIVPTTPIVSADPIEELRKRHLTLPVEGLERERLRDTFNEMRGSSRRHEALDILAPRDTPVLAVEDGTVAKLFSSVPGGLTVYQFDPTSTYAYYYAHLARYAAGLKEGTPVARGQTIGYVGTTGNAPPETPHLHFAIFALTDEKRWWQGTAIDPYAVLR
jgi:murein DD-endopeptidase MepM/ murein hydrolase activator NlpD